MGTFLSRPGGSLLKTSANQPVLFQCNSLDPLDHFPIGLEFDSVHGVVLYARDPFRGRPEMEEMSWDFSFIELLRFDDCPGSIVTELSNGTPFAEGSSCHTGSSTMPDEKVRKMGPFPHRNDLHQVELYLHRVLVAC